MGLGDAIIDGVANEQHTRKFRELPGLQFTKTDHTEPFLSTSFMCVSMCVWTGSSISILNVEVHGDGDVNVDADVDIDVDVNASVDIDADNDVDVTTST